MLRRILRRLKFVSIALAPLYLCLHLAQRPWRPAALPAKFEVIAHRGVHQTFHRRDLNNDTCTAERIDPPRHGYLENTLPSMQAAFAAGATSIEIDVHSTADGELVVWHDWTVDCRTEGHGETRTLTLAQLQALDAGYGYTADAGQSHPFRGKGVGLIPSLRGVLRAFPAGHFLIDQKDRDPATTLRIAALLDAEAAADRVCLQAIAELNAVYRNTPPTTAPRCTTPEPRQIKRCVYAYLKTGWSGRLPESCRAQQLVLPDSPWLRVLWGWPGTFIERIHAEGGKLLIYTDDPARVGALRALGVDGILTDRIEEMATTSGLP